MPRPRKHRLVCSHPAFTSFSPCACAGHGAPLIMAVDEFETIRLVDFEGLTQERCAEQMEVARTTIQAIYQSARKKLAQCIVQGSPLKIEGGDVRLCEYRSASCTKGCCKRGGKSERKDEESRE